LKKYRKSAESTKADLAMIYIPFVKMLVENKTKKGGMLLQQTQSRYQPIPLASMLPERNFRITRRSSGPQCRRDFFV